MQKPQENQDSLEREDEEEMNWTNDIPQELSEKLDDIIENFKESVVNNQTQFETHYEERLNTIQEEVKSNKTSEQRNYDAVMRNLSRLQRSMQAIESEVLTKNDKEQIRNIVAEDLIDKVLGSEENDAGFAQFYQEIQTRVVKKIIEQNENFLNEHASRIRQEASQNVAQTMASEIQKSKRINEMLESMKNAWEDNDEKFWKAETQKVYVYDKTTNKSNIEQKEMQKDGKPNKNFHQYKVQMLSTWVNEYWESWKKSDKATLAEKITANKKGGPEIITVNKLFVYYLIQTRSRWCVRFVFDKNLKNEGELKTLLATKRKQYEDHTFSNQETFWDVPEGLYKIYHISSKDDFSMWRLKNAWHTAIKENQNTYFFIYEKEDGKIKKDGNGNRIIEKTIGPIVYGDNLESVTSYHLTFD